MSTCTIGRVWLNAVVLKTTYPGMGTKVQILYRVLDSLMSHNLQVFSVMILGTNNGITDK